MSLQEPSLTTVESPSSSQVAGDIFTQGAKISTLETSMEAAQEEIVKFNSRQMIDLRDFGTVNDDDFDNTAALKAAMAERDEAGCPYRIFACPGDWRLADSLNMNDLGDLSLGDVASIVGVYSAVTFQHQEEGGDSPQKQYTRFQIDSSSESNVWWDQQRAYRFGPIAFRDITFQVINKGSHFRFGDMANVSASKVTARGIRFDRCYISRTPYHYGAIDIGDGRAWLIDADDDGHVLNQTNQSFGIMHSQLYDSHFDLFIRGPKYAYVNRQGDRPTGTIRIGVTGFGILEYAAGGSVPYPVASQYGNIWSENHILAGAVINGQSSMIRTEINEGNYLPPPGNYTLPSSITWSIGVGAEYVEFVFPGDYDCTDYFEPYLNYKFAPSTANESPRWLFVTRVTANRLYFDNAASYSYNPRTFAGVGTGIERPFGQGLIAHGPRAEPASISCGGGIDGVPSVFGVPSNAPIKLPANCNGRSFDPDDEQEVIVVANCCGTTDSIRGGIDGIGSAVTSSNPLFNENGDGPEYSRTNRSCIWNEATRSLTANAGRGVSSLEAGARQLTFHPLTEYGKTVNVLRPSDSTVGWKIRDRRLSNGLATSVRFRAYVHTASTTIFLSGQPAVAVSSSSLAVGWHTITLELTSGQMVGDGDGPYVQFSGPGYYIKTAVITQTGA